MLGLGLLVAAAGPVRGAPNPPFLALRMLPDSGVTLARFDPLSLKRVSAQVDIGEYHDAWSFSPDGLRLALARGGQGIGIVIVDPYGLKVVRDLQTGIAAVALAWLRPRLLVAALQRGGTVLVDPETGRIMRRWPDFSFPDASAPADEGLVMLFAGSRAVLGGLPDVRRRSIVPRLAVVDKSGRVGSVRLERIHLVVHPRIYSWDQAALAVDRIRRRAYVLAADGLVATVNPPTMRVSYHRLPSSLGGATGKNVLARVRRARWLGNGKALVFGRDLLRPVRGERFPASPAGAFVVDTATWRARLLDERAAAAAFSPGAVLVYGAYSGANGLRAYTIGGRRIFSLLDRERVVGLQIADGRVYAQTRAASYVIDLRSGKIVRRIVPAVGLVDVIAEGHP